MNETIDAKTSPDRLALSNPPETGSTAWPVPESQRQPPMQGMSPLGTQPIETQARPSRKERKLAAHRQSANSGAAMDSGEVHLFLCHRSSLPDGPQQFSTTHVGRFRNVETAIENAAQPSIRADIVLVIAADLLEKQPDMRLGEPGQIKS